MKNRLYKLIFGKQEVEITFKSVFEWFFGNQVEGKIVGVLTILFVFWFFVSPRPHRPEPLPSTSPYDEDPRPVMEQYR